MTFNFIRKVGFKDPNPAAATHAVPDSRDNRRPPVVSQRCRSPLVSHNGQCLSVCPSVPARRSLSIVPAEDESGVTAIAVVAAMSLGDSAACNGAEDAYHRLAPLEQLAICLALLRQLYRCRQRETVRQWQAPRMRYALLTPATAATAPSTAIPPLRNTLMTSVAGARAALRRREAAALSVIGI